MAAPAESEAAEVGVFTGVVGTQCNAWGAVPGPGQTSQGTEGCAIARLRGTITIITFSGRRPTCIAMRRRHGQEPGAIQWNGTN